MKYQVGKRPLDFRAWDKKRKEMNHKVLVGNNGDGDEFTCHLVWDKEREDWVHFDENCGDIMQWTGHRDREGTKIYEGDLVFGLFHIFMISEKMVLPIFWSEEDASFQLNAFDVETSLVVGNVCEGIFPRYRATTEHHIYRGKGLIK